MTDMYELYRTDEDLNVDKIKIINDNLSDAVLFPKEGREKVADFFLVFADQPNMGDNIVQVYVKFMKLVEETFVTMDKIPPEYLALLQSSNLILMTVNVIFIKAAYNKKHSNHADTLKDAIISILSSAKDMTLTMVTTLCHIDVTLSSMNHAMETSRQESLSFSKNGIDEIFQLLYDIFLRFPKQTIISLKALYLLLFHVEFTAAFHDILMLPAVLRQCIESYPLELDCSNVFGMRTQIVAVCVEIVSELVLTLFTNFSNDLSAAQLSALINGICKICGGINRLSSLTIISESFLFTKHTVKVRLLTVKHIGGVISAKRLAPEDPTICTDVMTDAAPDSSTLLDCQNYTQNFLAKAVLIILDVAMLDSASSVRSAALSELFPSSVTQDGDRRVVRPLYANILPPLQLVLKDVLRVAVFKCRDKSTEVRVLAFSLLEQALLMALNSSSVPCSPITTSTSTSQKLHPQEFIILTKSLLQVWFELAFVVRFAHIGPLDFPSVVVYSRATHIHSEFRFELIYFVDFA